MNRTFAVIAAAAAVSLAGCVPSTYGYGQNSGYYGQQNGGYNQQYPPYGNGYGNSTSGQFRCESTDHNVRRCAVDTRSGVQLVRQNSDAPCVQGRSWGYDRNGVWVSGGCRATFALGGGYGNGYGNNNNGYGNTGYGNNGYGNGYGNNNAQVVRCESEDERRVVCRLPERVRGVALSRQLSDTRCQQGYNWGFNSDVIWVDRGCRAEFTASY